jgi:hypothetical protein
VRGDELYYFASRGGDSDDEGAVIMRTALDAGGSIQPPDLEQLKRALQPKSE